MKDVWYRLRKVLLDPLAFALSRRELRRLMADDDLESVVDALETYEGRGFYARIHAIQNRSEILALAQRVRRFDPRCVVEIGTYKGGTLYVFCRAAFGLRHAVSIDLPGGDYGGGYDERRERLFREFLQGREGARLTCLRADSHAPETDHHVHRFWREIRDGYEHEELIENPDGNKGIGILWV